MSFREKFYVKLGRFTVGSLLPFLIIISFVATVFSFYQALSQSRLNKLNSIDSTVYDARIAVLELKIDRLMSDIYKSNKGISSLESSRVSIIEQKQKALEIALENDLEKAISIAMLRRDIDDIKASYVKRLDSLEDRIESIFQQLLWLSGSLIPILMAALSWVMSRKNRVSS